MGGRGREESALKRPLDLIRFSLGERVYVKLHFDRELCGKLHAYDIHQNMILGDVDEIATSVEIDDETYEETVKTTRRTFPYLFVRGYWVILVSPQQLRTDDGLLTITKNFDFLNIIKAIKEESPLKEPLDLISLCLDKHIYVKLHSDRELRGKLHAHDRHQNMILGDVEEIATTMEIDDETFEEIVTGILGDTGFPTATED